MKSPEPPPNTKGDVPAGLFNVTMGVMLKVEPPEDRDKSTCRSEV
jgi:hypothetical protein